MTSYRSSVENSALKTCQGVKEFNPTFNNMMHFTSLPTVPSKKQEIIKLFNSIKTGVSQCHNTGNEKDCSGVYTHV